MSTDRTKTVTAAAVTGRKKSPRGHLRYVTQSRWRGYLGRSSCRLQTFHGAVWLANPQPMRLTTPLDFTDPNTIVHFQRDDTGLTYLYVSTDRGRNWRKRSLPPVNKRACPPFSAFSVPFSVSNAVFVLVAGKAQRPVGAELRETGPHAWRGDDATRKNPGRILGDLQISSGTGNNGKEPPPFPRPTTRLSTSTKRFFWLFVYVLGCHVCVALAMPVFRRTTFFSRPNTGIASATRRKA